MPLRSIFFSLTAVFISQPLLFAGATMKSYQPEEIAALKPYTYYASTGYCQPADTLTWTCGDNCDANAHFQPIAAGGDGNVTQYWYAGYDPKLDSVIVAHQGVDLEMEHVLMTVMDMEIVDLDEEMFPGLARQGAAVHNGFMRTHATAANDVLAAVKEASAKHNTQNVVIVGHSLGGALGALDAVYLSLHAPDLKIKLIGYGMPRVGNTAFADYLDAHANVTRINNKLDPIPIVPSTEFGYFHPSGEVHIVETGEWVICPGQENDDGTCSAGAVEHMFAGSIFDHSGPYDGLLMGCEKAMPEGTPKQEEQSPEPTPETLKQEEEPPVPTPETPVFVEQDAAGASPIFSTRDTEL